MVVGRRRDDQSSDAPLNNPVTTMFSRSGNRLVLAMMTSCLVQGHALDLPDHAREEGVANLVHDDADDIVGAAAQ
jgi:hypothetical protein